MPRAIKYRMPPHPGRILRDDLLAPLGMSINQLAHALCVPANRLSQIVQGKRAITPDTSLRLARYFGFSQDYWLNLQAHYDLEVARRRLGRRIEGEIKPREAA
jgi:addiction module HigA family antidote